MYPNKPIIQTLTLLLTLLLAACGGSASSAPSASLDGTKWVLSTLNGSPALAGTAVTLEFDGDTAGGSAGCNTYGGPYTTTGNNLAFSDISMTMMACLDAGVTAQESAYLASLGSTATYQLSGGNLEISDAAGNVILVFALPAAPVAVPLEGTTWQLTTFIEGETAMSLLNGTTITAIFANGMLTGSAGCNAYSAAYTLNDPDLAFSAFGSTDMACQPLEVMEQEQRYLDIILNVSTYAIEDGQLHLSTNDGSALIFTP